MTDKATNTVVRFTASNMMDDATILKEMKAKLQNLYDQGRLAVPVGEAVEDYEVKDGQVWVYLTQGSLTAINADIKSFADPLDGAGETRSFSAVSINDRMRIAMMEPKKRFRMTILDYRKYWKQVHKKAESNPVFAIKLKGLFVGDLMALFGEILPYVVTGKQLSQLLGIGQVSPKLNSTARKLSLYYKRTLIAEKKTGMINKNFFGPLKNLYTDFINSLVLVVFPGIEKVVPMQKVETGGISDEEDEESKG